MNTFPWQGEKVTFEELAEQLRDKYPAPVWDLPPALVRDANNVAPFMRASPSANLQATVPWQLPPSPAKY